jgi:hypothetical protein
MKLLIYFSLALFYALIICSAEATKANPNEDSAKTGLTVPNDPNTLNPKQIRKIAVGYLREQRKQNKRTIRQQRKQVQYLSEELEAAIADAIAKNIFSNRALIVGLDERAIGEGMSKRVEITQEPAPDYPYYNVPRAHKYLYDADVQLQRALAQQASVSHYLEDITSLVDAVYDQKDAATLVSFQKDWIRQQVDDLIQMQ